MALGLALIQAPITAFLKCVRILNVEETCSSSELTLNLCRLSSPNQLLVLV
jgi:hypothetical protein